MKVFQLSEEDLRRMVRAGKSDLNPLSSASPVVVAVQQSVSRKQKDFRIIQSMMMICNWVDFTSRWWEEWRHISVGGVAGWLSATLKFLDNNIFLRFGGWIT